MKKVELEVNNGNNSVVSNSHYFNFGAKSKTNVCLLHIILAFLILLSCNNQGLANTNYQ